MPSFPEDSPEISRVFPVSRISWVLRRRKDFSPPADLFSGILFREATTSFSLEESTPLNLAQESSGCRTTKCRPVSSTAYFASILWQNSLPTSQRNFPERSRRCLPTSECVRHFSAHIYRMIFACRRLSL